MPPPLPDDLIDEIFLRLPPDEPACLVRASLASKLWLGLLTVPRFGARYRDFHGAPPILGFCPMGSYLFHHLPSEEEDKVLCPPMDQQQVPVDRYFSTTKFGARVPEDKGWGNIQYSVCDCRHGRVLLADGSGESLSLVVWDPMTGCRREMDTSQDYESHAAAVLCAVAGCHHRACHDGPSLVVSVGMETFEYGDDHGDFFARTWSSETGEWTDPCYAPAIPSYALIEEKPPVLIRDTALYFMIHYTVERQNGFLVYELGSSTLSVLDAPPVSEFVTYNSGYIHMAMEDGTLGFAYVDYLALYLWSRPTGSGALEPWTQHKVINLEKLPSEYLSLVGSVEGGDIIFVATDRDVYEIDLKSLRWKKLCNTDKFIALIPYTSFYHPIERVMLP